jgi:glycosyltransferase involved in cell wall biosynthesis
MMTGQPVSLSKRHCMVVHAYYPLAETRVQRESEALLARGYEVDVICLRLPTDVPEECHRGVQVYHLPVKQIRRNGFLILFLNYLHFFILAAIKLTQLHLRRPYHTVQVHNLPDFLVFCALIPKLNGVPVILDLHDLMPEFYAAHTGKGMAHWLTRLVVWQERVSCRFADHVITVTELWRRVLIGRGVPPAKISVVMNVADGEVFRRDAVRPLPRTNGRFHLLYHGTQVRRYGVDLILKAVNRLRSEIPELRVSIHGRGDYHVVLRRLVDELNLNNYVQFNTEYVPLSDLPELICAADVAVVPYRRDVFTDGILPTKLMEYAALGVPAIVARTPAISDYFDDTMVEFFMPDDVDELAACILKLYRDQARRTALVQNVNQFNERYNWTKLSNDYIALVESLRRQ